MKSKNIAPGQVKGSDLGADSVDGSKVVDESLTRADIEESSLRGVEGPQGPEGAQGQFTVLRASVTPR